MKKCKRCDASLPFSQFRPDPRYRDGYGSWCIGCHRARNSEWAKENRERLSQKSKEWRTANLETARATNRRFKRAHKPKLASDHKEWVSQNRDKRRATSAKRKAAKLQAIPKWSDQSAVKAIYRQAAQLQAETGNRFHVDHIVPLTSDLVCGLHCEANLQVIPGALNESKRNFWWPDGPSSEALL